MDKQRRKELAKQFDEIKISIGVFKVTNTVNGKVYLSSSTNLKNYDQRLQWQLDMGKYVGNHELQKDWTQFGKDSFTFEILEEKEVKDDMDTRWEIKQMEKAWLEKLQPYGEKGYNSQSKF